MAKTLKLQIVTPEASVYSADVDIVTLPTASGQIGILPNHVRLITHLVPGEIIARKEGHSDYLAVGAGLVEVTGEHVSILTDLAVAAEALTKPRLKRHVRERQPDSERRFLPKKWLLSTPL